MVTWFLFTFPHAPSLMEVLSRMKLLQYFVAQTRRGNVFYISWQAQSFVCCCANNKVHIEGLTNFLSRKARNWLEIWHALIWLVDLLAWLVFAKLSLTFLIAEMRSLDHFIIVICTFQPVALVLIFKITNYRRCSWVITSSSMVNCSFWLAIMTVYNTEKIGLMLEGFYY